MLIGEFTNNVSDKNRVAVPKKFRIELGNRLVITHGYEGCLIMVTPNQWEQLTNEAASGPFVSQSVRDTSRFLLGGASEVELDEQGRFVLPQGLLEYAHIGKEVTFLGLGRWLEIWDATTWQKRKNYISQNSGEIAEKLSTISV